MATPSLFGYSPSFYGPQSHPSLVTGSLVELPGRPPCILVSNGWNTSGHGHSCTGGEFRPDFLDAILQGTQEDSASRFSSGLDGPLSFHQGPITPMTYANSSAYGPDATYQGSFGYHPADQASNYHQGDLASIAAKLDTLIEMHKSEEASSEEMLDDLKAKAEASVKPLMEPTQERINTLSREIRALQSSIDEMKAMISEARPVPDIVIHDVTETAAGPKVNDAKSTANNMNATVEDYNESMDRVTAARPTKSVTFADSRNVDPKTFEANGYRDGRRTYQYPSDTAGYMQSRSPSKTQSGVRQSSRSSVPFIFGQDDKGTSSTDHSYGGSTAAAAVAHMRYPTEPSAQFLGEYVKDDQDSVRDAHSARLLPGQSDRVGW